MPKVQQVLAMDGVAKAILLVVVVLVEMAQPQEVMLKKDVIQAHQTDQQVMDQP
jgi:hypothetical protein